MSTFLDLFTYDRVTRGEQNRVFHNCRFFKSVGRFKPGDQAAAITIYLDLYIWSDGTTFDEKVILY